MVLARIEGAPTGTKGLSLFIVPKIWVNDDGSLGEPNDVTTASIEHKLGIRLGHGGAELRRQGRCRGILVGGRPHEGMRQMFRMMNGARIAVGVQGIAVASTAYLNALGYARERQQGSSIRNFKDPNAPRVPILEHSDIRRLLLEMKAKVEGTRALAIKLALHAGPRPRAGRAGRRRGRPPPGPGGSAHAAGEGLQLRPGVPRGRDGHADLRRRRLRRGLSGRAVLPRRQDLLDLRGHQPHPGDGSRRRASWVRAAARTSPSSSRRSAISSRSTPPGRGSKPSSARWARPRPRCNAVRAR